MEMPIEPVITWDGQGRILLADFGGGVSINQDGIIRVHEALPTPDYARTIAACLVAAAEWCERESGEVHGQA